MNIEPMTTTGQIRAVNPSTDLNAIADLIELCFKETIDEDGLDYIRYLRRLARDTSSIYWGNSRTQHNLSPIQGFVYEIDEKIVGNLSLIPFHKKGEFIYLIANVAVHPAFRRRRIAFELTARALKHGREKSAKSIWLQVRDDNPPAIALYEQMGFFERYRRSTFTIKSRKRIIDNLDNNIKVKKRKDEDWTIHKQWLDEIYPEDIRWNVGLKENRLLPGFWNNVSRYFSGVTINNISVFKGNSLIGFASLEKTSLFADNLWIVCDEENDEDVICAVVSHFRNSSINLRPLTINYPVKRGLKSFLDVGFEKNHTLIWMEEKIHSMTIMTDE